jgi:NADH pyrophosphatase NudC (nudix superfamily)
VTDDPATGDAGAGTGDEADPTAREAEDADDVTADDSAAEVEAVEPATSTYAWWGDGAACEACGARVDRRWQQDGRLVCPDCKEW